MAKELDPFVKKLVDAYNGQDLKAFDTLLAEDCVLVRDEEKAHGREEIKKVLTHIRNAFPDMQYRIEDAVRAGDRLVLRWEAKGTHRGGDYLGIKASGKPASYIGITMYELDGDMVKKIFVAADLLSLLRRIRGVDKITEPPRAQA